MWVEQAWGKSEIKILHCSPAQILKEITRLLLFFLFYFSFGSTRVRTQGFALAEQVLYFLSHTSSPFFYGYFGDRVLLFLSRLAWNVILFHTSHSSWADRHGPPHPAFSVEALPRS
jgi:hypothetical protein